jgi:hypothetical protein
MPNILLFENHISPEVNGANPDTALKIVLLPAPLAPIIVTTVPSATSKETLSSAKDFP